MKKFLTLLSIFSVIFAGYTNNVFAQDGNDSGTVVITEEDEEFCPFCNALAAAQASNMGCIILLQAPDGTVQMAKSCPPPPKGAKPCKTGKNCKPCPTCKKKVNPLSNPATPSKEEMTADKALKD